MIEALGPAIENHLIRAVLVSGIVALVLTAAVAVVWWRARRWTKNRSSSPTLPARYVAAFSGSTGPTGSSGGREPERDTDRQTGDEQLATRLIRDAAARAAALREAWDRSYREARDPRATESAMPTADLSALLQDLLREQRETNTLLRELVVSLRQSSD